MSETARALGKRLPRGGKCHPLGKEKKRKIIPMEPERGILR